MNGTSGADAAGDGNAAAPPSSRFIRGHPVSDSIPWNRRNALVRGRADHPSTPRSGDHEPLQSTPSAERTRKSMFSRTIDPQLPRTRRSNAIRLRVVSSILAFLLAVWIFYPVEVYRGHIPTYLAVAEINGESTFAGVVKVTPCEHPVLAARELGKRCHPALEPAPRGRDRCRALVVSPGRGIAGNPFLENRESALDLGTGGFVRHARAGHPGMDPGHDRVRRDRDDGFPRGNPEVEPGRDQADQPRRDLLEHAVATLRGWW